MSLHLSTRDLAKKLGLIEVIPVANKLGSRNYNVQEFDYFLVLDFESTCWDKEEIRHPPEIIEFSVVLYHVKIGKIVSEYQQYVLPLEQPKLSEFCVSFTGITQNQVDKGVPIGTCLMVFNKWINEQTSKYNLNFEFKSPSKKYCTFVTWSDWDLGNCLKNECRRKALRKPTIFNKWIDLRALYKEYYNRKPKGLNGALTEVGLTFKGNQHCSLHDARNTAYLLSKMVSDGVFLRITKDLNVT